LNRRKGLAPSDSEA